MLVVGIDPGLTGAIAAAHIERGGEGFELGRLAALHDMPVTQIDSGNLVCARTLLDILDDLAPSVIALEWPGPRQPGEGQRSFKTEWRFALGCGATLAVCQSVTTRVVLVPPNTWKSAIGGTSDKATRINLARKLAPGEERFITSKDGRAEAFLLIEHLRRRLNEGSPLVVS